MTHHYPDLGSASDWSYRAGNLIQPIRSTAQIWVVTSQWHGISALDSQTSSGRETSGSVAKCGLFSQASAVLDSLFLPKWNRTLHQYSMNNNGTELKHYVHTHRRLCLSSWSRGLDALNSSLYFCDLHIYYRVSGFESPLLFTYFSYGPNIVLHCDEKWRKTIHLWRSTFKTGVARLRSVTNRAKITLSVLTEAVSGMRLCRRKNHFV